MARITFLTIGISILVVCAFPDPQENKLDKATHVDVSVNAVNPGDGGGDRKDSVPQVSVTSSGSSGISPPSGRGRSKDTIVESTPEPGSGISRFLTDVFQIPIVVLQSVTKLLTNPFTPKRREDAESS